MRIAYSNLVDDATLTANSEDSGFPVENAQDQRLAKVWRTQSATGVTCVVDLGSAQDVNTVAIIGHDLTTSATLTIEANATDSWASASVSTSLTALDGMVLKFLSASESYRYWRFSIDDASAANSYVNVGRLWLGTYFTPDPASNAKFAVVKKRSDNVTYGRGRQKFATPGVGWREFDLSFRRTEGTALSNMLTMVDTVGQHASFIFANFDTRRDYPIVEPCYVSLQKDVRFRHTKGMKFEYKLTLEEDL
jgi:hypothetical protein